MSEGKVFLIDDDPVARQLYSRALEKAGFSVMGTDRVIGTASQINEFSPDLILLDVMMPALSGDKIVQILRQAIRSAPIIILFSNKSEDELQKLRKDCGADDCITKIGGLNQLLRKVNEHIWKRKGANA